MKKFLMIVGGICGVVILIIAATMGYGMFVGGGLDRSSKAWVDEITPKIVSTWNTNELMNQGSSEFIRTSPKEKLNELFTFLSSKLGKMKHYKESKGEATIDFQNGTKTITANYVATVEFEKGIAKIKVRGIKENDNWRLLSFIVNSDVFVK